MGERKRLEEVSGDTFAKTITVTDNDGNKEDITDWAFYITVKDSYSDADSDAVLYLDILSHDNASEGTTSFAFDPTETDDLNGSYYYDMKYEKPNGVVETFMYGEIDFVDSTRHAL